MEEAILLRIQAVSNFDTSSFEEAPSLRAAIMAGVDFGINGIARGDAHGLDVPLALLSQARVAARRGIDIDLVIRRCVAGNTVFRDFVVGEAAQTPGIQLTQLRAFTRAHDVLFDHLLEEVGVEYHSETRKCIRSPQRRRIERVRRLLAGELIDTSEFDYDFGAMHLGVIVSGAGAMDAIRGLAAALDRRHLIVSPDDRLVWAWLGGRQPSSPPEVKRLFSSTSATWLSVGIGEPGKGVAGWRATYHQANAAHELALPGSKTTICYADESLLAAVVQNERHANSVYRIFLGPLESTRDGGQTLRATLRAFFAAERNISSAAAALNVSRRTVSDRLKRIEDLLQRSIATSGAELELALDLYDFFQRAARASSEAVVATEHSPIRR